MLYMPSSGKSKLRLDTRKFIQGLAWLLCQSIVRPVIVSGTRGGL
eukprot:COSAG02_NODE_64519_length_260_cov_0.645963_2_plen_44_part_01